MAWIVIRATDNHQVATASPEQRRGLWRRGDVVAVLDVHPGRKVVDPSRPNLMAFEVEGVTAAELEHLTEPGDGGAKRARRLRLDDVLSRMPKQARRGAGDRLPRALARAFTDAAEARS
jgi:hypothetical protein